MASARKLTLKKYAFEFISIFVAVVLAFALNNWNENRKNSITEQRILREIASGLTEDLKDIDANIEGHHAGIRAIFYFHNLITHQPVEKDSFFHNYFNLTRSFISLQNVSGYETLKSKGLETIKNDSIRSKIIQIYEYDYKLLKDLEENYYEIQFQKNYFPDINKVVAKNIKPDKKLYFALKPQFNLTDIERNTLMIYFSKMNVNRQFILGQYHDTRKKLEILKADIEKEFK